MTSKVERYINYVVEDLVNNTKIDPDFIWGIESIGVGRVITPWNGRYEFNEFPLPNVLSSNYIKYVQDLYGVRYYEGRTIWVLYKERIMSLIDKFNI